MKTLLILAGIFAAVSFGSVLSDTITMLEESKTNYSQITAQLELVKD